MASLIDDLVKNSNEPDRWKACAGEIDSVLATVDMEAAYRRSSVTLPEKDAEADRVKALVEFRKTVSQVNSASWPAHRMLFTLGQLDTDRLILCCERKVFDWQAVLNAKAAFGSPEDLPRLVDAAKLQGTALDLSQPLRQAAKPLLLVAGLRHEGNIATTDQLLKMGADPAIDNGAVFQTAVVEGRADIGRVLARHGQQGLLDTAPWIRWAKDARKLKAYADFRQINWEFGRFQALDYQTLVETKPLPDNAGNLRIVFNFASRRVEEIHEFANPKQNVVTGFTFDDYGQAALEAAQAKLTELGGNPSEIGPTLRGKSGVAKPSVLGLGTSKP